MRLNISNKYQPAKKKVKKVLLPFLQSVKSIRMHQQKGSSKIQDLHCEYYQQQATRDSSIGNSNEEKTVKLALSYL